MWRSYLTGALRNFWRNRLHASITTLSLTVGFSAAILACLYWAYQTGHDRFWPNANRLYLVAQWDYDERGAPTTSDAASIRLAPLIRSMVPQVEAVARMAPMRVLLEHGAVRAVEDHVMWADPNLFEVLRPRALAGDPRTALKQAGSVVLTRALAQKYFGDTPALGQALSVRDMRDEAAAPMAMRVGAVIEDLPADTHIDALGFMSGLSAGSPLEDRKWRAYTYVLARKGAAPSQISSGLSEIASRDFAIGSGRKTRSDFRLLALPQVYLKPDHYGEFEGGRSSTGGMREGRREDLRGGALLAGLILAVAAINFVTLMTARGASRSVEIGVRKAAGARRRDLVVQFIGEALVYALLAVTLALAASEIALPLLNGLAGTQIRLDYLRDAPLVGVFVLAALGIGVAAGVYPALVLSSFRPARALKGGKVKTGSVRLRHALIAAQFVPLILLGLASVSLHDRFQKSLDNSLAMLDPSALMIEEACLPAVKARLADVPGVTRVACTSAGGWRRTMLAAAPNVGMEGSQGRIEAAEPVELDGGAVDFGTLEFHGMKLLAGRLFDPAQSDQNATVINRSAAARLGFGDPADAVGRTLDWKQGDTWRPLSIIGVVEDRGGFAGFERAAYFVDTARAQEVGMGLRFASQDRRALLAALDTAWTSLGKTQPMNRSFQDDRLREEFADQFRMVELMAVCIAVGAGIAAAGLFGLGAFLAEQKTKEIGIRKALGATRAQVLRRLLVQFAWPAILANLIAAGLFLGASLMQLSVPVAERFPIGPEIFAPVVAGSLLIALFAVFVHAWHVSGEQPVKALRYE